MWMHGALIHSLMMAAELYYSIADHADGMYFLKSCAKLITLLIIWSDFQMHDN